MGERIHLASSNAEITKNLKLLNDGNHASTKGG